MAPAQPRRSLRAAQAAAEALKLERGDELTARCGRQNTQAQEIPTAWRNTGPGEQRAEHGPTEDTQSKLYLAQRSRQGIGVLSR